MALRLELRHWQTLAAIVDTGSIKGAADRLATTQSALSHRLAEAERRLGGALFDRGRRQLRPTPAGTAMYQVASRVLAELARAESDFQRMAGQVSEVVRVGVAAYNCYHWFPRFLACAFDDAPQLQVELVAMATQQPVRSLLDGVADVVIAPLEQVRPGATAVPLFADELVLLTHPEHHLAGRHWIEPQALRDETYLTYSRTPEPGFEYERFIRPSGVFPRVVTYVELTGAIAELVAAGFGVSILSRWAMEPVIAQGRLAAVRCGEQGLALQWGALLRAAEREGSPARWVADLLHEWLPVIAPSAHP